MIWKLAIPRDRIVQIDEAIELSDTDDEDEDSPGDGRDKNLRSIEVLNHHLRWSWKFWTNAGQFQLEDFNFTFTRPRPELPTDNQLEQKAEHDWQTTRVSRIRGEGLLPVLLHVCQESRGLLRSHGYVQAFATRSTPPREWFNFSSECLLIMNDAAETASQFSPLDLERVKKLATPVFPDIFREGYRLGGPLPADVYEVVQRFGNLEELLLVQSDGFRLPISGESGRYRWDKSNDIVAVDWKTEELFGHRLGWERDPWQCLQSGRRTFDLDFQEEHGTSLRDVAEDIQTRLRDHPSLPQVPTSKWAVPEIRFVMLMLRYVIDGLMRSRARFRQYVEELSDQKWYQRRSSYIAVGKPCLQFGEDFDAQRDYKQSKEPHLASWDRGWICRAVDSMRRGNGLPALYSNNTNSE